LEELCGRRLEVQEVVDELEDIAVEVLRFIDKQERNPPSLVLCDQKLLEVLEGLVVGALGLHLARFHHHPQKGVAGFDVRANKKGKVVRLVLAQAFVEAPEDTGFPGTDRAVDVDRADPLPSHVFAFANGFFDLIREVEEPGIWPGWKGLLVELKVPHDILRIIE
jgi:hypothetical protein